METLELIMNAQKGNSYFREKVVEENMGLVYTVVRRFTGRGLEMEDLIQLGCIGLIKAIDKFDNSFGVKFSTYAVPMITGEIRRFLRDDGIIKISRTIKENQIAIFNCTEKLRQKNGQDPTLEEISLSTGLSPEEIVVATEAKSEVESLNKVIYRGDSGDISLEDKLEDDKNENEILINRLLVEQLISRLNDFEKKIIRMRYFENMTQTQVAVEIGTSQVQVSRMEKRILLKLRRDALGECEKDNKKVPVNT